MQNQKQNENKKKFLGQLNFYKFFVLLLLLFLFLIFAFLNGGKKFEQK